MCAAVPQEKNVIVDRAFRIVVAAFIVISLIGTIGLGLRLHSYATSARAACVVCLRAAS